MKRKENYIKFRPWNNIHQSELIETYQKLKENPEMLDLEDDFNKVQSNITDAVNEVCPVKTIRCTKPYEPWMKQCFVIQAQLDRNRLKKSFQKNKEDNDRRLEYRRAVRKVDYVLREARKSEIKT